MWGAPFVLINVSNASKRLRGHMLGRKSLQQIHYVLWGYKDCSLKDTDLG